MENSFPKADNFKNWSPVQVGEWLNENGFKEYSGFFVEHQITGDLLLDLDYTTLKDIGVILVGDRARILQEIKKQFAPKLPKLKTTSQPSLTSGSIHSPLDDKGKKSADGPLSSPKLMRRPVNNISTSSGALKSQARELFQSKSLGRPLDPSRDIYQRNPRNPRVGPGSSTKPLLIFPRSSSIKEKANAPHQQFSEALESVFGTRSQDDPNSPSSPKLDHSKDARDKLLREECVRVFGMENQSFVIKTSGLKTAQAIKEKIMHRFNINYTEDYQLFKSFQDNLIQLDDQELLQIAQTDNEHRGNLYLRKIVGHDPNVLDISEGTARSMQKISKFFGVDPSAQAVGKTPIKKRNILVDPLAVGPAIPTKMFTAPAAEKHKSKFFGERPPDEVIVDQLEQFFPGINTEKETEAADKVKSIVQANLINKRTSRRVSSLMLRRLTTHLPTLEENRQSKPPRPQAIILSPKDSSVESAVPTATVIPENLAFVPPASSDSSSSQSTKINESISGSILTQEPRPISFRWVPGRLIGQGAFGKVFHALNLDTGDFMAVKQVLSGGQDSTPQQKKSNDSLQREIELLSELDHDNIVRYFGLLSLNLGFQAGEDNTFNVFLEYVAGGSIASVLQKCGKLDEGIARSFTAQILCGLEYLHSRDIIHRDIKGANSTEIFNLVLVTGDGIVKISDFGISKKNEYTAYHRMTRMSMQGSIYWMAPEVARGKGYSAKVDIWSCGCLVLEMLTGELPWNGVRGNVIYLLGTGNAPPLPQTLSELANHFLKQTFEIDPEKRPTATLLLNHVFTEVDLSTIDFFTWSTEAMQRRAELGSSSEEDLSSSNDSEDETDDDSEESEGDSLNTPHVAANDEENTPTPTSKSSAISPIPPKIDLDLDLEDDLYDLNETGVGDISESLEHLMQ